MASTNLHQVINAWKVFEGAATPRELRAAHEALMAPYPVEPDIDSQPVKAGGVSAEWITAANARANRFVVYLHGGGFVMASVDTHRGLMGRISRSTEARVLGVNYRLAPEFRFPAALEDAAAAYRWLIENGAKASDIVIAGDSAGGGLSLSTLVALRNAADSMPAAAVCLSPWVDMEATGDSMTTKAAIDPVVQREGLLNNAKLYLGNGDRRAPLVSPLYADLTDLPPLLIQVGESEVLLDDSKRLAERAKRCGVDVSLEVWPEMIHVWQLFAAVLPEAQQAIDHIGAFIRARLS
jgi:monoterpene epsilon-lactone hydrolase